MLNLQPTTLVENLVEVMYEAGRAVMQVYASDFAVHSKADSSPVTAADGAAESIIVKHLQKLTPEIPIVAEEAASANELPVLGELFWLVDPLDGTKEFVNRNGEFTVNIALIKNGAPILGLVLAPALEKLYGGVVGSGAFIEDKAGRRSIHCRMTPEQGATVVASRSHSDPAELEQFLAGKPIAALINAGSSLKLCLIAEGSADIYPRLGRTMEWDIAAGQAVLLAAGGKVLTLDKQPLSYGKPGLDNPHFVAIGLGSAW